MATLLGLLSTLLEHAPLALAVLGGLIGVLALIAPRTKTPVDDKVVSVGTDILRFLRGLLPAGKAPAAPSDPVAPAEAPLMRERAEDSKPSDGPVRPRL